MLQYKLKEAHCCAAIDAHPDTPPPMHHDHLPSSMGRRVPGGIAFALFLALAGSQLNAAGPAPVISRIGLDGTNVVLAVNGVTTGGTYFIDRTSALTATNWSQQAAFEGFVGGTNWPDTNTVTLSSAFYRVERDNYHPRVGQKAILATHYHSVTGIAAIVNNTTIKLTEFNYDGGGITVVAIVSPNSSLQPYTVISDNLVRGQPYVNATMTFNLPPGTDLGDVAYFSIWCIDAVVSFGDGPFQ